jgi:hypothetical protein
LFEQYLKTGEGSKPIIVGYENQVVEFAVENPEIWKNVKDKVRILYPVPTVWSSHPLLVVNPKASPLINALSDSEIQKNAWERHGFRTGVMGGQNDPKILSVVGIPETINKVISMPNYKTMEKIINALQQ